jgi:hypothetical protein
MYDRSYRSGHSTNPVCQSLEIVSAHCGDGDEGGRIQGKAKGINARTG